MNLVYIFRGEYLRIPDSYDAKIAKVCSLWTFWPVIGHLVKKVSYRFLKDGLAAELFMEMCKGV